MYPENFVKIWLDLAKVEPGHFVFISIPMGDAKFVTKKGSRGGQPPILSRIYIHSLPKTPKQCEIVFLKYCAKI